MNKKNIGFHMSISGGVYKAIEEALDFGIDTLQIFLKNANRWESAPIKEKDVEKFLELWDKHPELKIHGHSGYLINLAGEGENLEKSKKLLKEEIRRAEILKIPTLVLHPGNHKELTIEEGIENIAKNLDEILARDSGSVEILLETMAGQGTSIGHSFKNIADIIEKCSYRDRLGVCLDTCHIFAAGYDFSDEEKYNSIIECFDKEIGLHKLKLIHLNDSKKSLGSRVDRHEHIGLGEIGEKALSFFVNDERLAGVDFIMETANKEDYGNRENLNRVLSLLEK